VVVERGVVGQRFLVMHVVLDGSAPGWEPVVRHKRKVIPDVAVNGHNYGKLLECKAGQRMAVEDPGTCGSEETDRDEFPWVEILCDPGIGTVVLMVYRMDMLVEETDLVMNGMPGEVFKVKDGESNQALPDHLEDPWCQSWKNRIWCPYPLSYRHGEDVNNMVPHGQ